MIMANRKYVDPTQVLRSLTDDFGNFIHVGEQRDIGEFNLNFLERIEEGLGELPRKLHDHNNSESFEQLASPQLHQMNGFSEEISTNSINAGLDLQFSDIKVASNREESKAPEKQATEVASFSKNQATMKEIFFGSKLEILKIIH